MTTVCPACNEEFPDNKAVCPACGTTHPDAVATSDATAPSDRGRQREASGNPYLRRMKIVNYAIAVVFGGLGGLLLFIRVLGLVGMGLVIGGSASGEYFVPPGAVGYVLATDGIGATSVGGIVVSLAASVAVLALFFALFVALGYSIEYGYQLGLAANLLVYVLGPLALGVVYGRLLVAVVVLLFLPTTYWPIVGHSGIDFEPSLREELSMLIPGLVAEFRRLVGLYRQAS